MDGDSLTEPSETSIKTVLEGQFPYYLAIGMSREEYWELDPYLVIPYREAQKKRLESENEMMWLQGYYNFVAASTALSNMHFDGKRHTPNRYMEKPLRVTPLTREEREAELEKSARRLESNLNSLMDAWNRGHPQEEKWQKR